MTPLASRGRGPRLGCPSALTLVDLLSFLSSLFGSSEQAARLSGLLEEEPIPLSNLGNREHHPSFDTHKFAMKFRYVAS